MTGSLQIKSGVYYAVLNLKDEYGKRCPKWICTHLEVKNNKRKAEEFLNKLLAEYDGVKTAYSNDILFTEYLYQWLEAISGSIEPNTYESYRYIINRYIEPYFAERKIKLRSLEPQHIQDFYNGQLKKGLSANTILKQHANIRKSLQNAVKMNIIPYNPADRITLPKKQKYIASFYTAGQVNNLLSAVKNEPIYPAVILTAFYGFRRSEVLGLKWKHIDFKVGTVTVQDTRVQFKSLIDKPRTKNKSSHRTLPLVPAMREFLCNLKRQQMENRLLLGTGYIVNDYVCVWDDGRPFRPDYITDRFGNLLKQHNLPHIRFHDLRHSAASMLLANGYSLKEIQEWLGHGDLGTTANIYAHLEFQAKQNMAASLGENLIIG
ncbi:MAG: site-specific integrase [Oscillospiraceae bacterium]|nr:site-specific integrase [Oscillospiraceae bacterium]